VPSEQEAGGAGAGWDQLRLDLVAEQASLDELVAGLSPNQWAVPTPAPGWTVADHVGHLAWFDARAAMAVTDPEGFSRLARSDLEADDPMEAHLARSRSLSPAGLLAWWRKERRRLAAALARLEPGRRLAWYGPEMGARSFVTARLMEAWAHGQDVADALGRRRAPTDRLRHVAHLGVATRRYSYLARGLQPPVSGVYVELASPSGGRWEWGWPGEADQVRGPAEDFCLVVTRRRHLDDTALEVRGEGARTWMAVAQAFAGPPGPGRAPGQFPPPAP